VNEDLPLNRQWPHSLETELALLGSMMLAPECVTEVLEVVRSGSDFFRATHQELFGLLRDMHEAGQPIDYVSVSDELDHRNRSEAVGGLDFLTECRDAVPAGRHVLAESAVSYAKTVRDHARKRALISASNDIANMVGANGRTADQLEEYAATRLNLGDLFVEPDGPNLRPWPAPINGAGLRGVAGDVVRLISPHTEADPAAILVQFLVGFGNLIGRGPYWQVESTRHHCNLNACVAGNTSKARKGTSWDNVRFILQNVDRDWADGQIMNGLSSGEGMIWAVRDAIVKRVKVGMDFEEREIDPGVIDKRALWIESEFGSTLSLLSRDGNTLNGIIRQAWDGSMLCTATKNSPARAKDAHVSMIVHVTCEELISKLNRTDAANGFANRFLWVCARRSQYLPEGGRIMEANFVAITTAVREAAEFARLECSDGVPLLRDAPARQLWAGAYRRLSEPKPGLLGAVTSRAEAQVMRLAAVYCLLDRSKYIRLEHLEAGLEVWRYCEESAAYLFGESMGDAQAERLLEALRDAGPEGLMLSQIRRQVFGGRMPAVGYNAKLAVLHRAGLASPQVGARAHGKEVWVAARENGEG
jgi:hypothetical protein